MERFNFRKVGEIILLALEILVALFALAQYFL